jgi:2,4-dienoyl-CoA reductase (NADPH2)
VTVFDKADKIGGNLYAYAANDLARPADLQSVIDYYGVMAKKLGVEVRLNTEANAKFMRSVLHEYDVCIVAAGARTDRRRSSTSRGSELLVDALEVAHGRSRPASGW